MNRKLIVDSSANLLSLEGIDFESVPLTLLTDEKQYRDDASLNVDAFVEDLKAYKGKSGSTCPNIHEWLEAFGDAEDIFAITITSELSGSYTSAQQARNEFLAKCPWSHVYVIDSLSAGPEMQLIAEKIRDLSDEGLSFQETVEAIKDYQQHTHLLFCLQSLKNLANNGRVGHATATMAGILGIRVLGQASQEGTLEILTKCRGAKRAQEAILHTLSERGYNGGKIRIAHCQNPEDAKKLSQAVDDRWPDADIEIIATRGLCSFYAESGGLMIGFEG